MQRRLHELRTTLPLPQRTPQEPATSDGRESASTVAEAPPPRRVAGYELLGELGRGGMGVVYKARQLSLGRLVALKMIRDGLLAGSEQVDRFQTEARAIARMQHPNIVQIYEIGEHEGRPFFSLELVDGGNLAHRTGGTAIPARQAAELVVTLARVIDYAHGRGIIHRDLKPGNVLLTADGTPKITDFGLAKQLEAEVFLTHTSSRIFLGTPSYMAPEQAWGNGQPVSAATDVYALGAILYELLTGRPPFLADRLLDVLEQVRSREPVPPRRRNPKLPRDLETICLKCLEKDPARRYASAADLADDLERFLAGQPILARPVGRGEQVVRWVKRRPAVAGLIGMSALACALAAIIIASLVRDPSPSKPPDVVTPNLDEPPIRYAAQLTLVDQHLKAKKLAQASRHLEDCAPELRGWEWNHLKRRSLGQEPFAFPAHAGPILQIAVSPKGDRFASAGMDGTVNVYDAASGQVVQTFHGHRGPVGAIAFSPDGTRIISATDPNQIGPPIRRERESPPAPPAPSPALRQEPTDLDRIRNATAMLVELAEERPAPPPEPVGPPSGPPSGTALPTWLSEVKVWDADTGRELLTLDLPAGFGVQAVAFSADGHQLITAGFRLPPGPGFGPKMPRPDERPRPTAPVGAGDWLPPLIASLGGVCLLENVVPDNPPTADPYRLGGEGEVRVWDADTGEEVLTLSTGRAAVLAMALHPRDGRLAAAHEDGLINLWDLSSGQLLKSRRVHADAILDVTFSTDGRLASAGVDRTIKVWNPDQETAPRTLEGHVGRATSVAFSPDGRRLVSASRDTTLKVWDPVAGLELLTLHGHTQWAVDAAFLPDGVRLVSADEGGFVRLWDGRPPDDGPSWPTPEERRPLPPRIN